MTKNELSRSVHSKIKISGHVELLLTETIAPSWLDDALDETQKVEGRRSRRREILFSVCFAETYLVEWVRDEVFKDQADRFQAYQKLKDQGLSITNKWKSVVKDICENELNISPPAFSSSWWNSYVNLVKLRSGIVHGAPSFPETSVKSKKEDVFPTPSDISNLTPGWATKTCVELVRNLHKVVGTSPPGWFIEKTKDL